MSTKDLVTAVLAREGPPWALDMEHRVELSGEIDSPRSGLRHVRPFNAIPKSERRTPGSRS